MALPFLVLVLLSLATASREGFVVDEDLVAEMTRKRVHIRLYDAFVDRHGRRPDQEEYDYMVALYQAKLREKGFHPRVEDAVPGLEEEDPVEEATYWVFYVLLGVAFAGMVAILAYVSLSRRRSNFFA